jgi:fatty acid synthase subunit alpha, fungi type
VLPKRKGRVGLMALFLSMLNVLAFPWHLWPLVAHPGGGGGGAVINSEEFLKFYICYLTSRRGCLRSGKSQQSDVASQARRYQPWAWRCLYWRDTTLFWHPQGSPFRLLQDASLMYYDIIFGRLTTVDQEITARYISLLNRADPDMLQFMQYDINQCDASKGETYKLAKEFGQNLIDNTREVIGKPPMYKDVALH